LGDVCEYVKSVVKNEEKVRKKNKILCFICMFDLFLLSLKVFSRLCACARIGEEKRWVHYSPVECKIKQKQ